MENNCHVPLRFRTFQEFNERNFFCDDFLSFFKFFFVYAVEKLKSQVTQQYNEQNE